MDSKLKNNSQRPRDPVTGKFLSNREVELRTQEQEAYYLRKQEILSENLKRQQLEMAVIADLPESERSYNKTQERYGRLLRMLPYLMLALILATIGFMLLATPARAEDSKYQQRCHAMIFYNEVLAEIESDQKISMTREQTFEMIQHLMKDQNLFESVTANVPPRTRLTCEAILDRMTYLTGTPKMTGRTRMPNLNQSAVIQKITNQINSFTNRY